MSERISESELAVQQAVDVRNEVNVMRRQHTARIRELTKVIRTLLFIILLDPYSRSFRKILELCYASR